MSDWLHRERMMLGDAAVARLEAASVMLFGVGGVGGFALEALVRAGIGRIALVDSDTVAESNINRQIIADTETVGMKKTAAGAARCKRINPAVEIVEYDVFADAENIPAMLDAFKPDYIIDAIDTISSKIAIIRAAKAREIPIVSCMGTGSKLDPTRFRIADIEKTHTCPLAKAVRLKLREAGIKHVEVLFSDEPPIRATERDGSRNVPGSVSFVPSAAGIILGGHVVKRIAELPV